MGCAIAVPAQTQNSITKVPKNPSQSVLLRKRTINPWYPENFPNRLVQNENDCFNVFMNNPTNEAYSELCSSSWFAFSDELIDAWLADEQTKSFFNQAGHDVPENQLEFGKKLYYDWAGKQKEEFCKALYENMKTFMEKQIALYDKSAVDGV